VFVVLLGGCTVPDQSVDDDPDAAPDGSEVLDLATKPDMTIVLTDDRGEPPPGLETADLVEGDGEVAGDGDVLTVHFVGASWSSGAQFDATWDRRQPFTFALGDGDNIPGWEEGIDGMRVGGRRAIVIPPELAYGDRGSGSDIAPGETIAFVVDLLQVEQ
jgi:peptidylprolyl isomerase